MKKKAIIIVTMLFITCFCFMGCSDDGGGGSKKPDQVSETISTSGWIQSGDQSERESDKIYHIADGNIPLDINATQIVEISFTIRFEDYDDEHSGTDGNSPEDEVEVTIRAGDISETASGTTPVVINIQPTGGGGNNTTQENGHLPLDWEISVHARCACEITYPSIPRPSAFNLYIADQGVAYTLDVDYIYEE